MSSDRSPGRGKAMGCPARGVRRHGAAWTAALLVAVAAAGPVLSGCMASAVAVEALRGPEKVRAQYRLPQRRTLVLVDDPHRQFNNPNLRATVATNVIHHLVENQAMGEFADDRDPATMFVSQQELHTLAGNLGEDYALTPIGRIGRLLDAEVVIHVQVERVTISAAGTFLRPAALASVRVLDVENRTRLFPDDIGAGSGATALGAAVPVQSELLPQGTEVESMGSRAVAMREIAARVGRDVARLFYDWTPVPVGRRFEEN